MELVVLIVVAVGLFLGLDHVSKVISRRADQHERRLSEVAETLETITEEVSELREQLMTPSQKEKRRYDRADRVTVSDVRQWKEGQIFHLVSCSYYYQSDEAMVDFFDYKHDHIDESEPTRWGFQVQGLSRIAAPDEWQPLPFLAGEDKCSTSDCTGTIRRV